ncbi:MAG: hypothetical protein NVV62_04435 [Terricaulis sp.]|nr:hypothetical protein [Terricaulis sp.]
MAKGQKRSNRETRKPKQPKKPPTVASAGGNLDPIRAIVATRRSK